MAGDDELLIRLLLNFGQETMERSKIMPYVSFVAKSGVIIARGYNREREEEDITEQDAVVAIRLAQDALGIGDLSKYSLYSLFEPTILGFDVALWAGIKRFVWCVNKSSVPVEYNKIHYGPLDYIAHHPEELFITNGLLEEEGKKLIQKARDLNYYSADNSI